MRRLLHTLSLAATSTSTAAPEPEPAPALASRAGAAQVSPEGQLLEEVDSAEPRADALRRRRLAAWSRRVELRRQIARPGAIVFALVAAAQAIGLSMQVIDLPTKAFWHPHGVAWWAFNVAVLVSFVLTVVLAGALAHSLADRREELVLQQHCRSLARYCDREKHLPIDHLGVHVWSVRDPRIWLLPRWLTDRLLGSGSHPEGWRAYVPRAPFLDRRAAYTSERRVHPTFTFTCDKGVIGRCWRLEREIVEDLESLRAAGTAAEFYRRFPYDMRYGLSWRQWWNSRHFSTIWAYPLFAGPKAARRFAGCVSVDLKCDGRFDDLAGLTSDKTAELESLLWDFAAVLRGDWRPTW
jgi:hypothetical protein